MKKRILLTAFVAILLACCFSVSASALHGDINDDGYLGIEDAIEAMRFLTGVDTPDDWEFNKADVNRDGYITTEDVRLLLRAAGDIQYLPDHLYSVWETEKEPTCSEPGFATSYCIYCGERAEKLLPEKEHKIIHATCSQDGYCEYNCGYSEPKLSHIEANGYCSVCNEKLLPPVIIRARRFPLKQRPQP